MDAGKYDRGGRKSGYLEGTNALTPVVYRHQPSQSRVDIEHWLKANTA